jgi:hypothetical protein
MNKFGPERSKISCAGKFRKANSTPEDVRVESTVCIHFGFKFGRTKVCRNSLDVGHDFFAPA